jgi:LysR family transcriptional regulator of gallate degradation
MSTSQLRAFVMIGSAKSFSAAARNMGVAQPSVHRVGRDFEKLLGIRLFKKVSYGIELTAVGRTLAIQANLALREIESAFQEVTEANGKVASRIVVGSLPLARTYLLPEAITRLCSDTPGASVQIIDGPYATLANLLKSGDLDIIIGALRCEDLDDDLVEEKLFDDGLSVIARADHPLVGKTPLGPEDFAAYPWIISSKGTPTRDHFDSLLKGAEPPFGLIESSSLSVLRGLLLRSDRLTLLSRRQIFYEERLGRLVSLADLGFTQRTIGLTTRKNWKPTRLQAALIGHLKDIAGD